MSIGVFQPRGPGTHGYRLVPLNEHLRFFALTRYGYDRLNERRWWPLVSPRPTASVLRCLFTRPAQSRPERGSRSRAVALKIFLIAGHNFSRSQDAKAVCSEGVNGGAVVCGA